MPVKKLPGKGSARMTRRAEPANRTKPSKQLTERNDEPNQLKFYLPPTQHINGLKSEGNQGENSSKRSFLPGRGFYPSLSTSNHYHNTKPLVHLPGGPIGKLVMHRRNRKALAMFRCQCHTIAKVKLSNTPRSNLREEL